MEKNPTEMLMHGRSIPQDIFISLAGEKIKQFVPGTSDEIVKKVSHYCPCLIAPTGNNCHKKEDRWDWAIGTAFVIHTVWDNTNEISDILFIPSLAKLASLKQTNETLIRGPTMTSDGCYCVCSGVVR